MRNLMKRSKGTERLMHLLLRDFETIRVLLPVSRALSRRGGFTEMSFTDCPSDTRLLQSANVNAYE